MEESRPAGVTSGREPHHHQPRHLPWQAMHSWIALSRANCAGMAGWGHDGGGHSGRLPDLEAEHHAANRARLTQSGAHGSVMDHGGRVKFYLQINANGHDQVQERRGTVSSRYAVDRHGPYCAVDLLSPWTPRGRALWLGRWPVPAMQGICWAAASMSSTEVEDAPCAARCGFGRCAMLVPGHRRTVLQQAHKAPSAWTGIRCRAPTRLWPRSLHGRGYRQAADGLAGSSQRLSVAKKRHVSDRSLWRDLAGFRSVMCLAPGLDRGELRLSQQDFRIRRWTCGPDGRASMSAAADLCAAATS